MQLMQKCRVEHLDALWAACDISAFNSGMTAASHKACIVKTSFTFCELHPCDTARGPYIFKPLDEMDCVLRDSVQARRSLKDVLGWRLLRWPIFRVDEDGNLGQTAQTPSFRDRTWSKVHVVHLCRQMQGSLNRLDLPFSSKALLGWCWLFG